MRGRHWNTGEWRKGFVGKGEDEKHEIMPLVHNSNMFWKAEVEWDRQMRERRCTRDDRKEAEGEVSHPRKIASHACDHNYHPRLRGCKERL